MRDKIEKIEDGIEKDVEKSIFHFTIPWPIIVLKYKILEKVRITPIKLLEDINFLKKLIYKLLFILSLSYKKILRLEKKSRIFY